MSSLATTLCFSLDRSPEAVQAGALVNSGRNSGGRSFPLSSPVLDVLGGVGCSSARSLSWVSQTSDDLPGTSWQGQRIWFQKHGLSHLMGKTSRGGMPGHPGCLRLRLRMVIHTCAQRFSQTQVYLVLCWPHRALVTSSATLSQSLGHIAQNNKMKL